MGTKDGAKKSVETILKTYGEDYFRVIGKKGGSRGRTGGFAAGEEGRERARKWGAVGGRVSRRRKKSATVNA